MPAKRALNLDELSHTPAKRPALDTRFSPLTGTSKLRSGHAKTPTNKPPQTDIEKMQTLQTKLERSMTAFVKAREELEEIVSAEGSSELSSFFSRGSADFKTELKRHRELVSDFESLKEKDDCQNPLQGDARTSSYYESLKSIMD